ncbi:MAG: hypothetical protein FWG54_05265 [Bacteroidetes bacterium]|nr:hypothetical protein [Bacteroidota bacterium]
MSATFTFSRIRLLFVRYFTENWRRDLTTLTACFIAFAVIPHLFSFPLSILPIILLTTFLFIGGMHFSAHIFQEMHHPSSGMHYLHIPASRAEKFFVNGILTFLLYPLVCFLLFYAALFLGNLLEPIMPAIFNYQSIDIMALISAETFGSIVSKYITYQSIFILGSLFFKKHPTTKTILSMIVCSIAFGIIQLILARILWINADFTSMGSLQEKMIQWGKDMIGSRLLIYADYLLTGMVALFFWTVAYLKFKEKEV